VADRLSIELGYPGNGDIPEAGSFSGDEGEPRAGTLDPEDELLVAKVRGALTQLADALGTAEQAEPAQRLVDATLNGAEMTMRGELMRGRCERLPALMPSFVFLVALPIVHQDEAFELSQRTFELLTDVRREL
jgi:hypothetical protein